MIGGWDDRGVGLVGTTIFFNSRLQWVKHTHRRCSFCLNHLEAHLRWSVSLATSPASCMMVICSFPRPYRFQQQVHGGYARTPPYYCVACYPPNNCIYSSTCHPLIPLHTGGIIWREHTHLTKKFVCGH